VPENSLSVERYSEGRVTYESLLDIHSASDLCTGCSQKYTCCIFSSSLRSRFEYVTLCKPRLSWKIYKHVTFPIRQCWQNLARTEQPLFKSGMNCLSKIMWRGSSVPTVIKQVSSSLLRAPVPFSHRRKSKCFWLIYGLKFDVDFLSFEPFERKETNHWSLVPLNYLTCGCRFRISFASDASDTGGRKGNVCINERQYQDMSQNHLRSVICKLKWCPNRNPREIWDLKLSRAIKRR
jgi:hypothetical protein